MAVSIVAAAGVGVWKLSQNSYQLPDSAYSPTAPADTPRAYQGAIDNAEDFSQIPCYCGCSLSDDHQSLRDCFISSWQDDTIIFSEHGAG